MTSCWVALPSGLASMSNLSESSQPGPPEIWKAGSPYDHWMRDFKVALVTVSLPPGATVLLELTVTDMLGLTDATSNRFGGVPVCPKRQEDMAPRIAATVTRAIAEISFWLEMTNLMSGMLMVFGTSGKPGSVRDVWYRIA